jgi:hypothetical protein
MRYALCAAGLIAVIVGAGHAPPLAAWGWHRETPAPPKKKAPRSKKKDDAYPLVGRWLRKADRRSAELRLIEFRESELLSDSQDALGGLVWRNILFEKNRGVVRIGELSLRVDLGDLGTAKSERRDFICEFRMNTPPRPRGSRASSEEADPEEAGGVLEVTIAGLYPNSCNLSGEYERVDGEGDGKPKVANTWLDLEGGRTIELKLDETVLPHSGADGYLHPGRWAKVVRKVWKDPPALDIEIGKPSALPEFASGSKIRVREEGSLVVSVGGLATPGSRIVHCRYKLGFSEELQGMELRGNKRKGEKIVDVDVLVLFGCRASWSGDDVEAHSKDRQGSWIVRILGGEELDPGWMSEEPILTMTRPGNVEVEKGVVLIGP